MTHLGGCLMRRRRGRGPRGDAVSWVKGKCWSHCLGFAALRPQEGVHSPANAEKLHIQCGVGWGGFGHGDPLLQHTAALWKSTTRKGHQTLQRSRCSPDCTRV